MLFSNMVLLKSSVTSFLQENKITNKTKPKSKCFIIVYFADYKITIQKGRSELINIKKLHVAFNIT